MEKNSDTARLRRIRSARLRKLIAEYENQSEFCAVMEENQGEISALSNPDSTKSFGEKKARSLEKKARKERGWLDVDEETHEPARTKLERVDDLEARMLSLFRGTDDQGRESLIQAALVMQKS